MSKRGGGREMRNFAGVVIGADTLRDALIISRRQQKFADPIFEVFPGDRAYLLEPNPFYPRDVGYGYLSDVPNNAAARVDAILERVASGGGSKRSVEIPTPTMPAFNMIASYAKDSAKNGEILMKSIIKIANSGTAEDVAVKMGVDKDQIQSWRDRISATSKQAGNTYKQIESLTAYVPYAARIINALVSKASVDGMELTTGTRIIDAAMDASIAALSTVNPLAGMAVSMAKQYAIAEIDKRDEAKRGLCREFNDKIDAMKNAAAELGEPIPWHAAEIFSPVCKLPPARSAERWLPTADQERLLSVYESNARFLGLTGERIENLSESGERGSLVANDRALLSYWWTMASGFMGHPEIYRIFQALNWDSAGGIIASDEQVLLVAAPFAIANGIEIRDFAIDLWNRCPGWRKANPASFAFKSYKKLYIEYESSGIFAEGKDVKSSKVVVYAKDVVANAWWLNWSVLIDTAIKIVSDKQEAIKAREKEEAEALARQRIVRLGGSVSMLSSSAQYFTNRLASDVRMAVVPRFRGRLPGETSEAYQFAKRNFDAEQAIKAESDKKTQEQNALLEKARDEKAEEERQRTLAEADSKLAEQRVLSTRSSTGPVIVRPQEETSVATKRQEETSVDTKKKEGLSTGAKMAIGVGIAALIGGGFYLYKRRR